MLVIYVPLGVSTLCSYSDGHISNVQLIFAVQLLITVSISLFSSVMTIHSLFIGHCWPEFHAPIVTPYVALVTYTLASSSVLLMHTTSSGCFYDAMEFKAAWLCRMNPDLASLPLVVSLASPVVVASLLPATKHSSAASNAVVWLSWLITVATLCVCVGLTQSSGTIMSVVVYVFLSGTVWSGQRAKNNKSASVRGLNETTRFSPSKSEAACSIYERDSVGSDFSKEMMRQLIANVAHDLKTVSLSVFFRILCDLSGVSFTSNCRF